MVPEIKTYNCKGYEIIYFPSELKKMPYHRYLMRDEIKKMAFDLNVSEKDLVVHHIDGNKSNNDLNNLKVMTVSAHHSLHQKGKKFSEDHKKKLSENCCMRKLKYKIKASKAKKKDKSLPFRVYKNYTPNCKQGFRYAYVYFDEGRRRMISSIDLDYLKDRIISKNLPWVD